MKHLKLFIFFSPFFILSCTSTSKVSINDINKEITIKNDAKSEIWDSLFNHTSYVENLKEERMKLLTSQSEGIKERVTLLFLNTKSDFEPIHVHKFSWLSLPNGDSLICESLHVNPATGNKMCYTELKYELEILNLESYNSLKEGLSRFKDITEEVPKENYTSTLYFEYYLNKSLKSFYRFDEVEYKLFEIVKSFINFTNNESQN